MTQCKGHTSDGSRCQRDAGDGDFCWQHEEPGWREIIHLIPRYDPVVTAGLKGASWAQICDENYGDYWFDVEAADKACEFFPECLILTKGPDAGQPFHLELWQQAVIGNLFGWKQRDGLRRYNELDLYIPRKNGKTAMAAGICNYLLFTSNEIGAEIYAAAADTDGTRELWDAAKAQRDAQDDMRKMSKIYKTTKTIERQSTSSTFRCVSADSRRGHSYNSYAYVIDELHLHKSPHLVEAFETSVSAREEPLAIYLTTRDVQRESICNDKEDYALKVCSGTIDEPSLLPVMYLLDEDEDWENENTWAKVNPNLGVSKFWSYMRKQIKKAKERPSRRNSILRLDLNMKVGDATKWIDLTEWDRCSDVDPHDVEDAWEWRDEQIQRLQGEPCWGKLDLSANRDLTAFSLWFPMHEIVLPWFWIPEATAVEREETEKLPYRLWEEYDLVQYCAGQTIDTDLIEERVIECADMFALQATAVDRWNSLSIVNDLMDELGEDSVIGFGQGYASMSYPSKELENLVLDGRLNHGGNPVLRSNADCVSVKNKRDEADNIKPDKDKSTGRIDGIVATIMAIGLAMELPEVETGTWEGDITLV